MLSTLSSVCVLQAGELGRWVGFPYHNVEKSFVKSHIISTILQDIFSFSQSVIDGENFVNFCGLLRKHEF